MKQWIYLKEITIICKIYGGKALTVDTFQKWCKSLVLEQNTPGRLVWSPNLQLHARWKCDEPGLLAEIQSKWTMLQIQSR